MKNGKRFIIFEQGSSVHITDNVFSLDSLYGAITIEDCLTNYTSSENVTRMSGLGLALLSRFERRLLTRRDRSRVLIFSTLMSTLAPTT